ncbi:MAG: hypothetical protein JRF72_06975, partial [Deltaproteobacteria bacterium]|nr:hypothetical protein [Deltaproteobacteria bacterium]
SAILEQKAVQDLIESHSRATVLDAIHAALDESSQMQLEPFAIYIVTHELIHIVRFSKFLQSFDASPEDRMAEEKRVHDKTHTILNQVRIPGISSVLKFYHKWRLPYEELHQG